MILVCYRTVQCYVSKKPDIKATHHLCNTHDCRKCIVNYIPGVITLHVYIHFCCLCCAVCISSLYYRKGVRQVCDYFMSYKPMHHIAWQLIDTCKHTGLHSVSRNHVYITTTYVFTQLAYYVVL